jgi:hypothetical protein
MIVGPASHPNPRPRPVVPGVGTRVRVIVAVAGSGGRQGIVAAGAPEVGDVLVWLPDLGRSLGFYAHEVRALANQPVVRVSVDSCRCPEGHPAHGGAA